MEVMSVGDGVGRQEKRGGSAETKTGKCRARNVDGHADMMYDLPLVCMLWKRGPIYKYTNEERTMQQTRSER